MSEGPDPQTWAEFQAAAKSMIATARERYRALAHPYIRDEETQHHSDALERAIGEVSPDEALLGLLRWMAETGRWTNAPARVGDYATPQPLQFSDLGEAHSAAVIRAARTLDLPFEIAGTTITVLVRNPMDAWDLGVECYAAFRTAAQRQQGAQVGTRKPKQGAR